MAHNCRVREQFRLEGTFDTYLRLHLVQSRANLEDRPNSEVRTRQGLVQSTLVYLQGRTWPAGQDE